MEKFTNSLNSAASWVSAHPKAALGIAAVLILLGLWLG